MTVYWWRKPEDPEKTTNLLQVTDINHVSSTPHHKQGSNAHFLVVISTDCTGSGKSNYHTIRTAHVLKKSVIQADDDGHKTTENLGQGKKTCLSG